MKRTVQVRVFPTAEQASALEATLRTCNAAATWLSEQMRSDRVFRKFEVHKRFYGELRQRFGLAAQSAIRVIGKTVDAYTTLRANLRAGSYGSPGSTRHRAAQNLVIRFRPDAAQPFDLRCLSRCLPASGRAGTVSIWTVTGRLRDLRILGSAGQLARLRTSRIGETDLIHHEGIWFLHATIDAQTATPQEPVTGFLGVDLGIVNIATTSSGDRMSGSRLNRYRHRQRRLQTRLQAKGTSSARRLLRKRRRTEARFATDVNHQISKQIVAEAERTGRGIAVEDLTGIRTRVRLRKPRRATFHSWAFAQLGRFLGYKAELAGIAFVQVDPAYTSQECHRCHWVDRKNRRSQAVFICGRCHFVGHADHNAAHNIAARGVACWGEVMRPHAAPTLAAGQGGGSNPIGRVRAQATGENVLVEQTAHHDDSVTPRSSSASRNARKA